MSHNVQKEKNLKFNLYSTNTKTKLHISLKLHIVYTTRLNHNIRPTAFTGLNKRTKNELLNPTKFFSGSSVKKMFLCIVKGFFALSKGSSESRRMCCRWFYISF